LHELLKILAPTLRRRGLKGSGKYYRMVEGDVAYVVNFQGSTSGNGFYLNLGAQPVFIPTVSDEPPDIAKLKEYECMIRKRVGGRWSWNAEEAEVHRLVSELEKAMDDFFGRARGFKLALAERSATALLDDFSSGQTKAFATLALARAAVAVGQISKARELVHLGLDLAGDAVILRVKLKAVLKDVEGAEEGD